MKHFLTYLLVLVSLASSGKSFKAGKGTSFPTITSAIKHAEPGDIILLQPGVYKENQVVIDKPLTLSGINYPVMDVEGKAEGITITSSGVTIQGLEIKNIATSYLKDNAAIKVLKSDHCHIQNNKITNAYFGIFLADADSNTVKNNIVTGEAINETSGGNAIHLWQCHYILIEGNKVTGHRDGIYFEFVKHTQIRNNESRKNLRYGLHFMFSDNNVYYRNVFAENGAGVAVMYSKDITMTENQFSENWGAARYGLLLKDITDSEIKGNKFDKNTIGIFAEGSNRLNIVGNDFTENGWGVKIMGSCEDVSFRLNNFISNTFEIATNTESRISFNFKNNYWSDYSGYDLNYDGIGDIPHRPAKLFSFVSERVPESIILLRSMFMEVLELTEKIAPVFTPVSLADEEPMMKPLKR